MSLTIYFYETKNCPKCGEVIDTDTCVFDRNITHNLNAMADKAGIYDTLWNPIETGKTKAGELIESLKNGLAQLKERPEYFMKFDSPNGWGVYEHFVPFVEEVLNACINHPEAIIKISK